MNTETPSTPEPEPTHLRVVGEGETESAEYERNFSILVQDKSLPHGDLLQFPVMANAQRGLPLMEHPAEGYVCQRSEEALAYLPAAQFVE